MLQNHGPIGVMTAAPPIENSALTALRADGYRRKRVGSGWTASRARPAWWAVYSARLEQSVDMEVPARASEAHWYSMCSIRAYPSRTRVAWLRSRDCARQNSSPHSLLHRSVGGESIIKTVPTVTSQPPCTTRGRCSSVVARMVTVGLTSGHLHKNAIARGAWRVRICPCPHWIEAPGGTYDQNRR